MQGQCVRSLTCFFEIAARIRKRIPTHPRKSQTTECNLPPLYRVDAKKETKRQIGNPSLKSCFVSHKLFKIASCPKVGREQSKNFSLRILFLQRLLVFVWNLEDDFFLSIHSQYTAGKQANKKHGLFSAVPVHPSTLEQRWSVLDTGTVACIRHWGSLLPALDTGGS